jgi:ATP-dependent protease ClpP protease subunit
MHLMYWAVCCVDAVDLPSAAKAAAYVLYHALHERNGSSTPELGDILPLLQLVPAVTELVISELLWLNYAGPEKPIYLYLNSTGSQNASGEAVGFDTEATAILDTIAYIRPEVYTLVIGQAFGNAAMLLSAGKKGHRFALPHARIQTCPPRMNR